MTNDLTFEPYEIEIEQGESVLWFNGSSLVHTVTAHPDFATTKDSYQLPEGAEPFHSGLLIPGETYTHRFDVPGTYKYSCAAHEAEGMVGWIEVDEAD